MTVRKLVIAGLLGTGLIWSYRATADELVFYPPPDKKETAPEGYLSRRYDDIFRRECPSIPVEFLRALAKRESDFNQNNTKGGAWGLLQVTNGTLKSYNEKNRTSYTSNDRLDPEINTRITCWTLRRHIGFYLQNIPQVFPGGMNWNSQRQVGLVVLGWNAGWSKSRGLTGVALQLLKDGVPGSSITIDRIQKRAATMPQITDKLKPGFNPDPVKWTKSVLGWYSRELKAPSV